MQSQGQEIVTGSCQAGLGLAQLGIIERDELRVRKEEDPWQKSCVLSLDGGGIRGYASLWMLKILMDTIERIEKELPEPHQSSFEPKVEQAHVSNSSAERTQLESAVPVDPLSRASTSPTLESHSSWRPFRRNVDNTRPAESQSPDRTVTDSFSNDEGYLPCHYFDYIGGTSTGGLNAIMLGRLRMRVEDCLRYYPDMARNVFSGKKRSTFTRIATLTSEKYDSSQLTAEIKKIVGYKTPLDATPLQQTFEFDKYHSPSDLCKTVVVANEYDSVADKPYLFRTYPQDNPAPDVKNPGPAHKHEIWKIARATSAAPTFFDPVKISGKEYSDGGVGNNNPVQLMLREVTAMAKTDAYREALSVLVSIGAGQQPTKRLKIKHRFPVISSLKPLRSLSKVIKSLKDSSTDVDRAHQSVKDTMKQIGFDHYYRWTGGEEVGGLGMDEWHPNSKGDKLPTPDFIEQHIKRYMTRKDIDNIDRCARELVKRRRERTAYQPACGKWIRYTYCTWLRCPYCERLLETRAAVQRHIMDSHPESLREDINLNSLIQCLKEIPPKYKGGPL